MSAEDRVGPRWEDPRRTLARHGLRPKRAFSQNFLVARSLVEAIADAAVVGPATPVVELGPGLGTLTGALLRRGACVHAVEKDRSMLDVLAADLQNPASPLLEGLPMASGASLQVEEGDAATVQLAALRARLDPSGQSPLRVVGNLPYAVTGAILRNLVGQREHVARAVVMVQREVRDRLLAAPGTEAYGALTVFVSAAYRVEPVLRAPAGAFHPPPKVDSAVVALLPRTDFVTETPALRLAVRACFEQRRKTLRNGLAALLGPARADAALETAGLDGRRRGETLSLEEIVRLADGLHDTTSPAPFVADASR